MSATWAVLLAVWFILANGFFVAVEYSLLAARPDRLDRLVADGRSGASMAAVAATAPGRPLATSQLGISAVSVLLGWAIAPVVGAPVEELLDRLDVASAWSRPVGVVVGVMLVALAHLVVGEMVPRGLALAAPERVAATLMPVHRVVVVTVGPAVTALYAVAGLLSRVLGVRPVRARDARTTAELAVLVDQSAAGGELDPSETELLAGALSFTGIEVAQVMAPRDQLVTVPHTATVEEAEQLVHRSGHSRVLVVGAGPDDVTGFLHAKDLIGLGPEHHGELLPPGLVRVALRVAPDDRIDAVLPQMRRVRRHVAVVARGGSVVGLVTLEDILEAIVGDIRDESDGGRGAEDE